jgi:hypothetical protein
VAELGAEQLQYASHPGFSVGGQAPQDGPPDSDGRGPEGERSATSVPRRMPPSGSTGTCPATAPEVRGRSSTGAATITGMVARSPHRVTSVCRWAAPRSTRGSRARRPKARSFSPSAVSSPAPPTW